MREEEILGLILLVYDYEPALERKVEINNYGYRFYPTHLIGQPINYLKRKGYFKNNNQPTKKLLNLLRAYNVEIKQLREQQEEFRK